MILVKINGKEHWNYSQDKYKKYIYRVLQFVKTDTTYAILHPYLKQDWSEIDFDKPVQYWNFDPRKIVEVDIRYLDIIHQSEIPENVIRDFKLSFLVN
jgi:hypothetical protein